MRRLINQHHIIGHLEILRTVKTRIIRLNDMKVCWIFLRKIIEELLKVLGIYSIIVLNQQFAS